MDRRAAMAGRKVRTPQGRAPGCSGREDAGKPRRWKVPQKTDRCGVSRSKGEKAAQETTVRRGDPAGKANPARSKTEQETHRAARAGFPERGGVSGRSLKR